MINKGSDVVGYLEGQHERVKGWFEKVLASSGEKRRHAFYELRRLLAIHETAEEEIVHPAARRALADGEQIVRERLREENEAKKILAELDMDRIAKRYFFESDMLYNLNQLRAVVVDMPMRASYGDEASSLRPMHMIGPFMRGNLRNFFRRLLYSYFLRGFSVASMELALGLPMFLFGLLFGVGHWIVSIAGQQPATAGTVMLAALPLILGTQLLLSWLNFDVSGEPRQPVHSLLSATASTERK